MAVTMSAGGYVRSDFMISDAALPIRIEELQQEQATEFAKVLGSFENAAAGSESLTAGSYENAGSSSELMTATETVDAGDVEKVVFDAVSSGIKTVRKADIGEIESLGSLKAGEVKFEDCDEQTKQALLAASLPDDPQQLMRMVLRGDIKLSDIPEDKLSPEFLMLLALIRRTNPELLEEKKPDKTEEGADGENTVKESDFDYEKLLKEELANQDQLMAMLLNVPVDKTDEMGAITDAEKMVEEIISVDEIEPPVMSWSAHIKTETEAEETEASQVPDFRNIRKENVEGNFDMSIFEKLPEEESKPVESGLIRTTRFETIRKVNFPVVKPQPIKSKGPVVADKPVVPKAPVEVQRVDVQPANVSDIVNTAAEIGTAGISVTMTSRQTNTMSDTMSAAKEFTAEDAQQFVISAAEPVANTEGAGMEHESDTSGNEQMFNGQMLSDKGITFAEETAETNTAADTKAVVFEVKQSQTKESGRNEASDITPEKSVQTEKTAVADVKPLIHSRVKSASEELEMLRSAKSKTESTGETELLQHTENPLISDEPIVFFRDGEKIEVRPSEILSQAAEKLIETARDMPKGETEYSLELNPEELGKITVKMTKAADGAVTVTIAAENARTRRVLEENSGVMQDNLRNNGVRLESWQTVNESDHENRAQDYNGSAKNPYHHENSHKHGEDENDNTFAELIASM